MPETIAEPLFGSGFLSLSDISALSTTCKALLPLRGHLERVVLRDYNVTAASPSVEAEAFTRLLLAQKALRVLELRYRPLGWVLPFLAHPRSTRALESLNLSWNILQPLPVCLDTIFTPGAFPSLRELTLGGPWSAEGAVKGEGEERISTSTSAWLSPSVFPRLVSLTLVDVNGLDTPYLLQRAFGTTAKWLRLEKLVLEGRLGGTCFMATLAEAIGGRRMPRLRCLELMDPFEASEPRATAAGSSSCALVALIRALRHVRGSRQARFMVSVRGLNVHCVSGLNVPRQVPALEHLSLGGSAGMSGEAVEALGQAIGERALPCLTAFQLLSCNLKAADVRALVRGLTGQGQAASTPRLPSTSRSSLSKLAAIDLRRNEGIGDAGVIALAEAFAESRCCPSLDMLELQDCGVGDVGVEALARALKLGALPQLKSLALSGPVTHVGISALADALRAGGAPRLEGLYLWDTPGLSQEEASLKLARALTEGACPLMKEFGGNPSEAALELLRARGPAIQVI